MASKVNPRAVDAFSPDISNPEPGVSVTLANTQTWLTIDDTKKLIAVAQSALKKAERAMRVWKL